MRHERMCGNNVHFVCADDAHGAPIMIAASKQGVTPQEFVAKISAGRQQYLDNFYINFDHWHCTESPENTELSQDIYRRLKDAGLIYTTDIEQFYDEEVGMFLADRFIKGTCPKCGAPDQYGDSCEKCSSVYSPTDLIDPYSAISGSVPVLKTSTHYFFRLSDPRAQAFLKDWTMGNGADGKPRVQAEVLAKDNEWLDGNLADWDISRDAPYFGIEIPDAPGKYFYVWLDAPIGYLASFKAYCAKKGLDFVQELSRPDTEQIHFIGKDIIYFHTLFWPAMLHFAGTPYRVPDHVNVHGFMTVNGQKMSKSLGNSLLLEDLLKKYSAETIKFALLQTNYRADINVTDDLFPTAEKHLVDFYRVLEEAEKSGLESSKKTEKIGEDFVNCMDDDFNTALAISNLFGYFKTVRKKLKDGDVTAIEDINAIRENYDILGLFRADAKEFLKKYDKADAEDNVSVPEEIFALAEKRKAAKAEKNYALADEIRKEIADKGFILVDTKDGFTIKKA